MIRLRVLDSDAIAAFGWPDGRIYLTRALVDLLDDQDLTAAISHELGHLLIDGYPRGTAALRGCNGGNIDDEKRADRTGVERLQRCGIPASAMSTMLAKVAAAPGVPADCRRELIERIAQLADSP